MKLFISAVALCLIATSYCADKKPGETCTKDDKCTLESECKQQTDLYCPKKCMCKGDNKMEDGGVCKDKPATLDGTCKDDAGCEGSSLKCTSDKCKCPTATPNYIKKAMTCTDKVLFNGECDTAKLCDTNMECKSGKCACKATYEKEDSNDQQCSKKKLSTLEGDCTDDAGCEGSSLKCTSGNCKCPTVTPNYIKISKTCTDKVLFDGACDTTKLCDTNMECKSSKCACKATYEKEDSNDQLCSKKKYTKFGEDCTTIPCNTDMLNLECSAGKKCVCPANFKDMTVWYMKDDKSMSVVKCLNEKANVKAKEGDKCFNTLDKTDIAAYCEKDLKCQACPGSTDLKCRKKAMDTSGVGQLTFSMSVVLGCYALKKIFM